MLRPPGPLHFEFRAECPVLVPTRRADQSQLVIASLHGPSSVYIDPRGVTRTLDLPVYLLSCLIDRVRAVIRDDQRIRLARIVGLHRGIRGTNDDRGESAGPSEGHLSPHGTTPIISLFAVLVFVEDGG